MWVFSVANLAQELIYMVVMIGYMKVDAVPRKSYYQVLDFFSGAARISKLAAGLGFGVAAVDISYSQLHNLNTSAGFV